jgi:ABC-type phosphate transport system permease subunit
MNINLVVIGSLCLLACIWMLFWENKNTFNWWFWFVWVLLFGLVSVVWGLFEDVILK